MQLDHSKPTATTCDRHACPNDPLPHLVALNHPHHGTDSHDDEQNTPRQAGDQSLQPAQAIISAGIGTEQSGERRLLATLHPSDPFGSSGREAGGQLSSTRYNSGQTESCPDAGSQA
jgi:hypothetical protein